MFGIVNGENLFRLLSLDAHNAARNGRKRHAGGVFLIEEVAAEMLHTFVGCFGLVTVAPLTAVTASAALTRKNKAP